MKETFSSINEEAAERLEAAIIGDKETLARYDALDRARDAKREENRQEDEALRITYTPGEETVVFTSGRNYNDFWDFEEHPVSAAWVRELMLKREESQIVLRLDGKMRIDTLV